MYKIKADVSKNRIYIILKGALTNEELKKAADLFIQEVQNLKAPVDAINDISEFSPGADTDLSDIKRAQLYLAEYGLRKAIRVVRDKMDGAIPFVSGGVEAGYHAGLAFSVEEAEKMLDENMPQNNAD
ncbi:MAG: hypothetical protein ABUK01_07645 [Leptospirales bacterium]